MSRPGELRPDELAAAGGDQLWTPVAAWFKKTDDALFKAFGFRMRIKSPYGGYRTKAEQQAINPGLSYLSSDHCKGRAIDIDNHRDYRNINEAVFETVMRNHGWVFTARSPDPKRDEPWHAVNYNTIAPAGGGGTPLEDDMLADERQALFAIKDALFKKDSILDATTGAGDIPGGLLKMAAIQYDANFNSVAAGDPRDGIFASLAAIRAELERIGSGASAPVDLQPVLDAIAKVEQGLGAVPSADQNGQAARTAIVAGG
jgi:hypothetical protein